MIQIDQRKVGASGLVVPALGVGVWSWGEAGRCDPGVPYLPGCRLYLL
jgi:aryl-alcohol dehydrogenase-like predicted oxidoreductase